MSKVLNKSVIESIVWHGCKLPPHWGDIQLRGSILVVLAVTSYFSISFLLPLPVISNRSARHFEGNINWQGKMDFWMLLLEETASFFTPPAFFFPLCAPTPPTLPFSIKAQQGVRALQIGLCWWKSLLFISAQRHQAMIHTNVAEGVQPFIPEEDKHCN